MGTWQPEDHLHYITYMTMCQGHVNGTTDHWHVSGAKKIIYDDCGFELKIIAVTI